MLEPLPTTEASAPYGSVRTGDVATAERFDTAGFVEQEYLYGGTADALDGDGRILATALDYTTRILVRRPAEPGRFSGVVFIEPFHHIVENPIVYRWISDWLLDRGHAWIGVTVHTGTFTKHYGAPGGVPLLQRSDPDRYRASTSRRSTTRHRCACTWAREDSIRSRCGGRRWSGTRRASGSSGSLAKLVKANDAESPLPDLDVRYVCGIGTSQTGNFWRAFIDFHGDDAAQLPDGPRQSRRVSHADRARSPNTSPAMPPSSTSSVRPRSSEP